MIHLVQIASLSMNQKESPTGRHCSCKFAVGLAPFHAFRSGIATVRCTSSTLFLMVPDLAVKLKGFKWRSKEAQKNVGKLFFLCVSWIPLLVKQLHTETHLGRDFWTKNTMRLERQLCRTWKLSNKATCHRKLFRFVGLIRRSFKHVHGFTWFHTVSLILMVILGPCD